MAKALYRVALVGPAGVGKTTHAKLLQQALGGGDVLSFAGPMKRILRELFGARMEDPEFARTACQLFGTDFARKLHPDVWVEQLAKKVPETRSVFVDDCRFYNEFQALKKLGFTFARLRTHPQELARRRPAMTAAQHAHASEQEQATFREDVLVETDTLALFNPEGEETCYRWETEEESIARVQEALLAKLKPWKE